MAAATAAPAIARTGMRAPLARTLLCVLLAAAGVAHAAVSAEEAARLKTDLTPLGGERAGNKDGTIPPWTGGYTTPIPGFVNGGRRPDPFAAEKPLYSITSANMEQYASKLTDGTKAMLKKYPRTFRVDVYPTHRTAAAPQWVYDNTARNATHAHLDGEILKEAFGGIPFPIPKTGREIVANHELLWRGAAWATDVRGYLGTADGNLVMTVQANGLYEMPYYDKDSNLEKFSANNEYWYVRLVNSGPPVRAGEAITGRLQLDEEKSQTWVYLTGQRRVRKLPNACCDTPTPATSGVMNFDELDVIQGRVDRFDWKIVGKQEMLIPYNSNRLAVPASDAEVLGKDFLNPDHVRWELHRVWVVESTVRAGQRHQSPRSRYYLDEDTWMAVLADRWDQKGQLWRMLIQYPFFAPDLPGVISMSFGMHDFNSGVWFINGLMNGKSTQVQFVPGFSATNFQPEALAAQSIR